MHRYAATPQITCYGSPVSLDTKHQFPTMRFGDRGGRVGVVVACATRLRRLIFLMQQR